MIVDPTARLVELRLPTGLLGLVKWQENRSLLLLTPFLTVPVQGLSSSPPGPYCTFPVGLHGLHMWQLQCRLGRTLETQPR